MGRVIDGGTGDEGRESAVDDRISRAGIGAGLETNVVTGVVSGEYPVLHEVVASLVGGVCDAHWEGYVFDIIVGHVPWYVAEEYG